MHAKRRGFTLVELLVVIGLIVLLATLILAVNFKTSDQRRVNRAAEQVQGWLLIAKQRAIRDRAVRGVQVQAGGTGLVYVEQPEPWTPALFNAIDPANAALDTAAPPGAKVRVPTWDRDLVLGTIQPANPTDPRLQLPNWRNFVFLSAGGTVVNPGDTLEILEPPSAHQIQAVFGPPGPPIREPIRPGSDPRFRWYDPSLSPHSFPDTLQPGMGPLNWILQLGTPVPGNCTQAVVPNQASTWQAALGAVTNFRISRQPQAMMGEAPLQLPKDTGLTPWNGMTGSITNGPPLMPGGPPTAVPLSFPLNVMFGTDGRLIGAPGNVILWVDDTTGSNIAAPQLIVIYSRTGLIGSQPVDTTAGNSPYHLTWDGQSSGL